MILISEVDKFEGKCKPTWLNKNQVFNRLDGGVTGFFKLVVKKYGIYWRTGEEFYEIIKNGVVYNQSL